MNWKAMDVEALKKIYEEGSGQLQQQLLKGASWNKVARLRKKITALSSVIYERLNGSPQLNNPAEHGVR